MFIKGWWNCWFQESVNAHRSLITLNDNSRKYSHEPLGKFSVKSLSRFLESSSPLDGRMYCTLWKFNCAKKTNILIWIMLNGNPKLADILRRRIPHQCLLSSIFLLCNKVEESLNHIFLEYSYAILVDSQFIQHSMSFFK